MAVLYAEPSALLKRLLPEKALLKRLLPEKGTVAEENRGDETHFFCSDKALKAAAGLSGFAVIDPEDGDALTRLQALRRGDG